MLFHNLWFPPTDFDFCRAKTEVKGESVYNKFLPFHSRIVIFLTFSLKDFGSMVVKLIRKRIFLSKICDFP